MQSLEILKQELINQKNLLDDKGFPVDVANLNPSPSEITRAIEKINFDFTSATASPEDVKVGKTFYAQTGELKTGTFDLSIIDQLENKINTFISGEGRVEINISPTITRIRPYSFYDTKRGSNSAFYGNDITIPSSVTIIGEKAFYNANITGKLVVPASCTTIGPSAFYQTNISEAEVYAPIKKSVDYLFYGCSSLVKISFHEPTSHLGNYCLMSCSKLEEVYLPSTLTSLSRFSLRSCPNLKFVKFTNSTPVALDSGMFTECPTAIMLVPYLHYDKFYNATNYQQFNTSIFGHGDFAKNEELPTSIIGYSIVWYTSVDDAKNATNPVTICPEDGTMYAVYTEIVE